MKNTIKNTIRNPPVQLDNDEGTLCFKCAQTRAKHSGFAGPVRYLRGPSELDPQHTGLCYDCCKPVAKGWESPVRQTTALIAEAKAILAYAEIIKKDKLQGDPGHDDWLDQITDRLKILNDEMALIVQEMGDL